MSSQSIALAEKPGHVTQAIVIVDATPAQIYALVTDYAQWPAIFSDDRDVTIECGGRRDARVRFHSLVLEHAVTVQFDNVPDRAIEFEGVAGPPGGRAGGTYVLEPVDGGRHTHVVASLYLDVVGLPALFVRDSKIAALRQAKLRVDLGDVIRALELTATTVAASSPIAQPRS